MRLVRRDTGTGASVQRCSGFSEREIERSELPKEAVETIALIRKGGPFPYQRDGAVFGNREKHPAARASAAGTANTRCRRPASAAAARAASSPAGDGTLYYTDDHYRSFKRILE